MDVVCDRCKTEYEFDDALVSERGTTVKCTNCSHQFKIYRNGPPGDAAKTWSLRRPDGTTIPFDSLSMLQKWILEGRVNRFDELSRAGEPWKPLGAIAELESFFANAEISGAGPMPSPATESIPSPLTRAPNPVVAPALPSAPPTSPASGGITGRQGTPFHGTGGRSAPTPGVPASGISAPRPLAPRPPALPGSAGTLRPAAVPPPVPQSAQKIPSVRPPPAAPPLPNNIPPPPRAPSDLGPAVPSGPAVPAPPRPPAPPVEAFPAEPPTPRTRQPDPSPRPRSVTPANTPPPTPPTPAPRLNTPLPPPELVAPAFHSRRPTSLSDEPAYEEPAAPPSRLRGIMVGAGLGVLVLGLGVVGAWQLGFLGPRVSTTVAPPVTTAALAGPMLDRARGLMLRGDRHSLEEARDELTRAIALAPDNRVAQATRADVMASWSELLRQRAADIEARATIPGADAPALRAEAALMRREADERAERARADEQTVVSALDQVAPGDRPRVEALLGDVARVLNDRTAARQHLDAARGAPDTDFFSALLDRDEGNAARATSGLQTVVTRSGDNARARIALARLAMTQNDANTARMQLDAVGRTYVNHEDATALADALTRNEPPMQRDGQNVALNTPPVAPTNPVVPANPVAPVVPPTPPVVPPMPPVAPQIAPVAPTANNGGTPSAPSGNYDSLVAEADRLQNDGRTQQARERYQRALSLRPSGPEALTGMGNSDLDMHNYSSAISRFRQALSANSNYSEALIGMGEAYGSRGDYPQALRAYQQYLEVNPNGSHASMARRQIESLQDRINSDGPPGPTRTTPAPQSPNGSDHPSDNPSNTPGA